MRRYSTRQNKFIGFGTIVILIAIWQMAAMWVGRDIVLPTPINTAKEIVNIAQTEIFYQSVGITVFRTLITFLLSFTFSLFLGGLSYKFDVVEAALKPIVVILRSVPTLVFILMLLFFFSRDIVPIIIGYMILFPMMYQNVLTSMKETSRNLLEMARVYHLTRWSIIKNIYLPSMKPYLKASALSGISLCLKVVIAGEIMGVPKLGIGSRMIIEKINYNTVSFFAYAMVTISIALLLNYVVEKVR